jgi:hypothetical protein
MTVRLNFFNVFDFFRPKDFIECDPPIDHKFNKTAKQKLGHGCVKVCNSCFNIQEKRQLKNIKPT